MQREIKVCGIIYKKDKQGISILLENENPDGWNVIFDSLENEEGIQDKAKQVAQKHSGLNDIRLISDLSRFKYWFQNGQNLIHRRVYSFLFELPQTSSENPETDPNRRWYKPDEALQTINGQDAKLIVQKALEKLKVNV